MREYICENCKDKCDCHIFVGNRKLCPECSGENQGCGKIVGEDCGETARCGDANVGLCPKCKAMANSNHIKEQQNQSRADVNMHTSEQEEVEMVKHSPDTQKIIDEEMRVLCLLFNDFSGTFEERTDRFLRAIERLEQTIQKTLAHCEENRAKKNYERFSEFWEWARKLRDENGDNFLTWDKSIIGQFCFNQGYDKAKKETEDKIKNMIDEKLNGSSDDSEFALGWEYGLEELKFKLQRSENDN
jgi:hypothetical protein